MQIIISNIEQFRNFFDVTYKSSSEDVELQLFPDRMVCVVLDRSRTKFFHVQFNEDFFDEYVIDEVSSITVSMDDMYKLLKSCNKKDTLYLDVDDPYLVAKIESENGNNRIFEFVLPSDFVESPSLPSIDLPAVCECNVGELKQSVKDIDLIGSNKYTFVADGNALSIVTDKDIPTKYANTIDVDFESECDVVSSTFNIDFIKDMLNFDKISKVVTLKMGDDLPLLFNFKDELMGVTVSGLFAPLLSEED